MNKFVMSKQFCCSDIIPNEICLSISFSKTNCKHVWLPKIFLKINWLMFASDQSEQKKPTNLRLLRLCDCDLLCFCLFSWVISIGLCLEISECLISEWNIWRWGDKLRVFFSKLTHTKWINESNVNVKLQKEINEWMNLFFWRENDLVVIQVWSFWFLFIFSFIESVQSSLFYIEFIVVQVIFIFCFCLSFMPHTHTHIFESIILIKHALKN